MTMASSSVNVCLVCKDAMDRWLYSQYLINLRLYLLCYFSMTMASSSVNVCLVCKDAMDRWLYSQYLINLKLTKGFTAKVPK